MVSTYTPHHSMYLAHRITLQGHGEDSFAQSLSVARVDTKPHQVDAALFALHSPLSKGVILADEVGLGKTIEASLVIAQRWAERRRRILLIVPASLRKQWQQELQEKFSLPSRILDARTWRETETAHKTSPLESANTIIITSYEFAALRSQKIQAIAWDLVVFDEAHRLRNVYKSNPKEAARAKALRDAVQNRFKLMLTATPLQNSLMELYGLVSVIDEQFFGDARSFKMLYGTRRNNSQDLATLRHRLTPIYKRHLRQQVQQAGHVAFTQREAVTFDFDASDQEMELYDQVSAYLQRPNSIAFGQRSNQLVIILARKILGSSVAAITGFLQTVLERLRRHQEVDADSLGDVGDIAEELNEAILFSDDDQDHDTADDPSRPGIDPKQLAAEITEVEGYIALAQRIAGNTKGAALIARLPEILDKIVAKDGQRKAVIFTESVRTQNYLAGLLNANGYAGQIVLLNGTNNDPDSQALYRDWLARHQGTDAISGAKSADMKAAVVEAFRRDDKTILIATESGAEGINLQFCSIVLNYDLPWNPQRIEQRIGRCHRYGQKIDVTVVNMLNRRNHAEQRIYTLLEQKFRLFQGVFGVSDTVLGAVESGIDFERKVVDAVQKGRSAQEVADAFAALERELDASIKADMAAARQRLFDTLDQDVVARLRQRDGDIRVTLKKFEQRLLTIVRAELPDARFHPDTEQRFDYDGKTWTTEWPLVDDRGWQFFRLTEDSLASSLVQQARSRSLPVMALTFDHAAYTATGRPPLASVQRLAGRSGWLSVARLSTSLPNAGENQRDRLVIAGFADDEAEDIDTPDRAVDDDTIDALFLVPAQAAPWADAIPTERLAQSQALAQRAVQANIEQENAAWLEEETTKLEAWSDDMTSASDLRIEALDQEIKEATNALRANAGITLAERLAEQQRIKNREGDIDDLKMEAWRQRRAVRAEINQHLNSIAESLRAAPVVTPILTLRWTVAA